MSSILEFIMVNETLIMAALFAVIIILLVIVLITDAINRKKSIEYKNALFINNDSDMMDAFSDKLEEEKEDYTTEFTAFNEIKNEDNKVVSEIKYVEDDEELEKTKAQIELKNLKEELIRAELKEKEEQLKKLEEEKENISEEIIDINEKNINKIDEFEQKQEENAIISIDQFNKVSDKIYSENEEVQYKDEGNEPISIQELEKLYNTIEIKTEDVVEKNEEINNNKSIEPIVSPTPKTKEEFKFKKSPIISPVYGFDTEERLSQIELENTANLDKLEEEIRKTNEFLNTLKELRKNLE